jgi:multidrug efflux pump subunit AcrA (membrane-fusion protein)
MLKRARKQQFRPFYAQSMSGISFAPMLSTEVKNVEPKKVLVMTIQTADVLQQVDALATAFTSNADFFANLLQLMSEIVDAEDAHIWQLQNDSVELMIHSGGNKWIGAAHALAAEVAQTVVPTVRTLDGFSEAQEKKRYCLLVPFVDHQRCNSIGSFVVMCDYPAEAESHLAILTTVAERVGRWHILGCLSQSMSELKIAIDAKSVIEGIGKHIDVKPMAYGVVNRLQTYLEVDRVSLAIMRGKTCVIKAISNQAVFDRRSNVVKRMEALASRVGSIEETLIYPNGDHVLPPALRKLVERYFEASNTNGIMFLPIFGEPKRRDDPEDLAATIRPDEDGKECVGVLVLEGIEAHLDTDRALRRWERVRIAISNVIANSRRHDGLWLMPVWRALGNFADFYRGHTQRKAMLITGAIAATVLALVAVPAQFKVRGEGAIQPVIRQHIYAEVEGTINELHVSDGDHVHAGALLMSLKNPELAARVADTAGKLNEAKSQLQTVTLQRVMRTAKTEQEERELVRTAASTEAKLAGLQEQFEILKRNEAQLNIQSPIEGDVITWDVQQRLLDRPVKPGQRLLTIAVPSGGWEIELRIPDKRAGYILNRWNSSDSDRQEMVASFVLTSDATRVYRGHVIEVAPSSNADDKQQENVVRVRVRLTEEARDEIRGAKPGTSVIGHVHCGRASIGYCKLYEFFDWMQRVWFRFVA